MFSGWINSMSEFMVGYKAKIAGVGLMLTGLGGIAAGLANGPDWLACKASFVVFMNGLGIFGIRAAVDSK